MKGVRRLNWYEPGLLSLLVGAGVIIRVWAPDLSWFNTHMSRDLARAIDWLIFPPPSWAGPEINFGERLPGPAFYWILATFWTLTGSIPSLLLVLHLLTIGITLYFCRDLARDIGKPAALVFFLNFFLMPVHVFVSRTLWNPSLVVPLNIAFLICIRRACMDEKSARWVLCFCLLSFIGVQVHFSTLAGCLAGTVAIILFSRGRYWMLAGAALLLIYILNFYNFTSIDAATGASSFTFISFSWERLEYYLLRWNYHLFLTDAAIGDYELFPVIFHYGRAIFPEAFRLIGDFLALAGIYVWAVVFSSFIVTIFLITSRSSRVLRLYSFIIIFWTCFCLIPMYFYVRKNGIIPYRYGLMLYPVQFLVLSVALARVLQIRFITRRKLLRYAVLFPVFLCSLLVFAGDALFDVSAYATMARSGRASHVSSDTFEIVLRYKTALMQIARELGDEEVSFRYLHGPIVDKVRFKEYDWDYRDYYGGIKKSLPDKWEPHGLERGSHYRVQSFSIPEMISQTRPFFPFHLVRLLPDDIPADIQLSYLNSAGEPVYSLNPGPDDLILPFQMLPGRSVAAVRVAFTIAGNRGGFLHVCFDDRTVFLLSASVDHVLRSSTQINAGFLAPKIAVVPLPSVREEPVNVELVFKIVNRRSHFSRIDVFRAADAGT